ncbi:MAG: hypothetical protein KDC98_17620, partial [Planctomycetes bacterium]|nr:hypothetical protein [Planctomycetota bacterium]
MAPAPQVRPAVHGRIEDLGGGLELLRVWGTPEERGYAHGSLLADKIVSSAIAEFTARFARQQPMLELARSSVG